jgi:hypothetical protein
LCLQPEDWKEFNLELILVHEPKILNFLNQIAEPCAKKIDFAKKYTEDDCIDGFEAFVTLARQHCPETLDVYPALKGGKQ